ncbi:type IV pilus twitching motility protein PilT [Natranaerobius thermophilus]|uniref:type IV pilus twitching motility protein PilT n=1 Tax=Natranaerobius thermophilus TaxID=375929 RepID=UPI00059E176E
MTIDELLSQAVSQGASDLHVTVESPPIIRKDGELFPLSYDKFSPELTEKMAKEVLAVKGIDALTSELGETDLSYSIPGTGRFRINVFLQRNTYGISCRVISSRVPNLEELGLPPIVKSLAQENRGLVVVTGATGSGKSTTLAAMIDEINKNRTCHVVTLEDPIEYLHNHNQSIINQREIGSDSAGYAGALRAALRQDPDVILVGEMRDRETIQTAITAAETGHLVLTTLHTVDAPQTIDRIVDVFPPHQQNQIRVQLAGTLKGILAQQLLPKSQGGRVAALECLVSTSGIKNLIREGKTYQIYSQMQTGAKLGMQTMESAVKDLFQNGLITEATMEKSLPAKGKLK